MKRRLLAAFVAAVSLSATPAAHAAPAKTTVNVVTTLASQPLPRTFVSAAWSVDQDKSDRLAATGFNPAGVTTTVTATWQGTRRVGRTGRLLDIALGSSDTIVMAGPTTTLRIEYRLGGVWYEETNFALVYSGVPGPNQSDSAYAMTFWARAAAGRTVPVRLTAALEYSDPTVQIDDTFRVLPQK